MILEMGTSSTSTCGTRSWNPMMAYVLPSLNYPLVSLMHSRESAFHLSSDGEAQREKYSVH